MYQIDWVFIWVTLVATTTYMLLRDYFNNVSFSKVIKKPYTKIKLSKGMISKVIIPKSPYTGTYCYSNVYFEINTLNKIIKAKEYNGGINKFCACVDLEQENQEVEIVHGKCELYCPHVGMITKVYNYRISAYYFYVCWAIGFLVNIVISAF